MRVFFLLICCMFSAATVHAESDCVSDAAIPASTPDSELTDSGDGTITDGGTGTGVSLMWKKCLEGVSGENCDNGSPTLFTWQQALKQPGIVNKVGFPADFKDWRLPTLTELRSLVEVRCYNPAINPNRFPNTPSSSVWSATPYADASDSAWVVNFYHGLPFFDHRNYRLPVRLVRTAQ